MFKSKHEDHKAWVKIQISAGPKKKKPTKAMRGHYEKSNVVPTRKLYECHVGEEDQASYELGSEITLDAMNDWSHLSMHKHTVKVKVFPV